MAFSLRRDLIVEDLVGRRLARELPALSVGLEHVEMARANATRGREERPSLKEIADRAAAEAERQAIRLALQATRGRVPNVLTRNRPPR
jgi:hypothetical protein